MNNSPTIIPHILIVGDVMLDRYWFGDVNRISPEAPVPVVLINHSEERLGGAANVARNVAALGAKCGLMGIVGHDEAGQIVENLLSEANIVPHLHKVETISTIVKLRIVGRQQQLLRLDFEKAPPKEVLDNAMCQYQALLPSYDIVIFSDYGKGTLNNVAEMIAVAKSAGKITLVDPKGDDFSKYQGASFLTPNISELRQTTLLRDFGRQSLCGLKKTDQLNTATYIRFCFQKIICVLSLPAKLQRTLPTLLVRFCLTLKTSVGQGKCLICAELIFP